MSDHGACRAGEDLWGTKDKTAPEHWAYQLRDNKKGLTPDKMEATQVQVTDAKERTKMTSGTE